MSAAAEVVSRPRRFGRASWVALGVAASLLVAVLAMKALRWRIVLTPEPSLGAHVLLCRAIPPERVVPGMLVSFPFPAESRYYRRGEAFVKQAACVGGQTLEVDPSGRYFCDGAYLVTALPTDKDGRPVPRFEFRGRVPEGMLFVTGTHRRSYDSRYWGFVDARAVDGVCYRP